MAISTKDLEILNCLYSVEKSILDEYEKIYIGEFSSDVLIKFLNIEEDLIDSITLTSEKVEEVESFIRDKVGAPLDSNLPLGINECMTNSTYPYLRLVSRIRYRFKSQSMDLDTMCEPILQDVEIGLFYKSLIDDAKNNPNLASGLLRYARMCLVDSPRIEREVIENGMEPLECIDDYFGFYVDFWKANSLLKTGQVIGVPYEGMALRKRQERLDKLFDEMHEMADNYLNLRKHGVSSTLELVMCTSYFKAVVAMQPKKRREVMHENFMRDNEAKLEQIAYRKYISSSKDDVEDNLVPAIRRFEFVPCKKM